ncbi:MAG: polyprenyl synthetase family protein, partial [Phycisphaerae bacterium]
LGDFLLSKVFKMCAELRPEIAKEIAWAAMITCQGELNQNLRKHNWKISQAEYIEVISDKTAAIFKSCCRLGAFLSGADEQTIQNLTDFGLNIGIAFQIVDDLLDVCGDKNRTGKNIGNDFETAKPTLPLIHFLGFAENKEKSELLTLLQSETSVSSLSVDIKQKLIDSGSLDYSKQYAEKLINEAINNLAPLPQNPAKTSLIETAKFILHQVN